MSFELVIIYVLSALNIVACLGWYIESEKRKHIEDELHEYKRKYNKCLDWIIDVVTRSK